MKLFIILFFLISITSCSKTFIQVFETQTLNTQVKDGFYVYENDTLKITYSFWAPQGVLSLEIFNKLEKPLYIDWKNSSFICNNKKLDYWIEEVLTKSISVYGGYFYKGPLLIPSNALNFGFTSSSSSSIKPERLTFIPPKSNYNRSQFYLMPLSHYPLDSKSIITIQNRNDNPKKKTTIYSTDFNDSNSPLKFRNFIAYSISENSTEFKFVDNQFYLKSVKEMDERHYKGKNLRFDPKTSSYLYQKPYDDNKSFYINVPTGLSFEYRKFNKVKYW